MTSRSNPGRQGGAQGCRHLWRPFADAVRIWQVCDKCGDEQHVGTHDEILAANLRYILRQDDEL